jgi:hypothetical protein
MRLSYDYEDLFRILNTYKVRYLVVGAYAVAYYTEPRFTKDIDIWAESEVKNAQRLYKALGKFGAPLKGITADDFLDKKTIYQIGVAPIRVDIMMSLTGVKFKSAWQNKKRVKYGRSAIYILGKGDLIKSKKAIRRKQDILDLEKLSDRG